MTEDYRANAIQMNLVTENSNKAQAELQLEFYASKEAQGVTLDVPQAADKAFWEANLAKAVERIAYFEALVPAPAEEPVV